MHLQPPALGVGGLRQGAVGVLRRLIEGVVLVLRPNTGHLPRRHEAGHIVDMAVGLVGVDAIPEPQHLLAAQILAQLLPDLRPGQIGIPAGRQQAHLRGQHGTLAVHMDGAALQHEALGAVGVHVRHLTDLLRYLIVPVPREVQAVVQAAPCVEGPVHCPQAALTVYQKGGAAVPDPCVVGGHLHHPDLLRKAGPCILILSGADAHGDLFKPGNGTGHLTESLLCGLGPAAPVVVALRPEHPHPVLGFKFRRHPVAVRLGSRADDTFCHIMRPPAISVGAAGPL